MKVKGSIEQQQDSYKGEPIENLEEGDDLNESDT